MVHFSADLLACPNLDEVGGGLAGALDDGVVCDLDALPTGVAVHGVVAADHSGDGSVLNFLQVVLELLGKLDCCAPLINMECCKRLATWPEHRTLCVGGKQHTRRSRTGVAAVGEEVHVRLGHAGRFGGVEEGQKVADVAVDATVRDQAEEVDAAGFGLGVVEGVNHGGGSAERLLLDREVNAHNVLDQAKSPQ